MTGRAKSLTLVAVQFCCLAAIALTGPIFARQPMLLVIELLGIGLGLWAIVAMRPFNFNITPDVKVEGYLVERGPYVWIRHPMYASLILIGLALVVAHPTPLRWTILALLIIDLVVKLRFEEGLLSAHYETYAAYMQRSKRLIPYVW